MRWLSPLLFAVLCAGGTLQPTQKPTTPFPTQKPTTSFPTQKPTSFPTQKPTTSFPTASPTTPQPTAPTSSPTRSPTKAPTTGSPVTASPTHSPATISPTTYSPTSKSPTLSPTTLSPTTVSPTTVSPTTVSPTTVSPTTVSPTTVSPTTVSPTTASPTTVSPTKFPTKFPTLSPTLPTQSPTKSPTTNSPTQSPTKVYACPYTVMSTSSSIEVEDCAGRINLKTALAVSVWVKLIYTNDGRTKHLFHAQPSVNGNPWFGITTNNSDASAFLGSSDTPSGGAFKFQDKLDTLWHHFVVSWTASSKIITVYVDAGLIGNSSIQNSVLQGDERIVIGKGATTYNFDGLINQFTLYNRAITSINEVRGLYWPGRAYSGQANYPPLNGLVLLIFEDLDQNRVLDMSPNGHALITNNINIGNNRATTICNARPFCTIASCLRENNLTCLAGGTIRCGGTRDDRQGLCMDGGGTTDIKCQCAPGYSGPTCAIASPCDTNKIADPYASFSGNPTDFIQVDDCTLDLTLNDFTVSFWAQPSSMSDMNPVFSTGEKNTSMFLSFLPAGVQFGWGNTASTFNFRCAVNSISVVSKQWHLIVARYQRSTKLLDIWVDGQMALNATAGSLPPARLSSLLIGKLTVSNTNYYYKGLLDEFRIHQRFLSATEISMLLGGNPPATTNLIAYFSFDDFTVKEVSARPGGSFLSNIGNITITSSAPVCRLAGTCNPDPCSHGVCGVTASNTSSCACYNNQGFFLDSGGTCTKPRDPRTQCDDGFQPAVFSANFRSAADCVQLKPCMVQLSNSADFSIEVWFRRANETSRSVLFSRGFAFPSNLYLGFENQTLQFGWGTSLVSFYCGLLKDGWHHATGVFSTASGLVLYIDGVQVSSLSNPTALTYTAADNFFLGCAMNPTAVFPFLGSLSQLHVYSRGLSSADVAAHFANNYNASNSLGMVMDLLLDADTLDRASASHSPKTRVHFPLTATPDFSIYPLCLDYSNNPCAQGRPCGSNGDCRPGPTPSTTTCFCRPGYYGPYCNQTACTQNYDQFLDLTDGASSLSVQTCDVGFFTSAFSISMWVKAASGFVGPAGVFGHGDRANGGLALGFASNNDIVFGWGTTVNATLRCSAGEDWHLLVGVYNVNSLTLYMDGGITGGPVATLSTSAYTVQIRDFLIGAWKTGGIYQFFTGQIDEVRIYREALAFAAVTGLQTNVLPISSNLAIYLPMITLADYSVTKSPVTVNSSLLPNQLIPAPASPTRSLCFPTSACTPNPCGVNSLCTPTATSYTCTCAPGYMGTNCNTPYNVNTTCPSNSIKFSYGAFNSTSRMELELTDSPLFLDITFAFWIYPLGNGVFLNYANILTMFHAYPDLQVAWNATIRVSACAFPYSAWRHYTVTLSSAGVIRISVNGVFRQQSSATLTLAERSTDLSAFPLLTLGSPGWTGYMSNFRIYRKVLSTTDINALFASNSFSLTPDVLIPFLLQDASYSGYRHVSAGGILEYSTNNPLYIRKIGVTIQSDTPTHCRAPGNDPCSIHPCNYGSCMPNGASFTCSCFKGFTDTYCNVTTSSQCPRSPTVSQGYVEFGRNSNATLQIAGCGLQFNKKSFTFSTWVLRNVDGIYADSLFRFASLAFRFRKPNPLSYFEFTLNNASYQVLLSGWNGWRHIAGTFNYNSASDNGIMTLYLDGKPIIGARNLTKTVAVSGSLVHQGHDAWVGPGEESYNYDADPDYLQGGMSDLRLYDIALSDSQILYLYDSSQGTIVGSNNLQIHMLMTNTAEQLGLGEMSPNGRGVSFERYKLRVDNVRDVTPFGSVTLSSEVPLCRAPNPCYPNPCVRGACTVVTSTSYTCACTPTFNGSACANPVNRTSFCVSGLAHGHTQFGATNNPANSYALSVPRCEIEFASKPFTLSGWFFPLNPSAQAADLISFGTSVPRLRLQGNTLSFSVASGTVLSYTICEFNEWIHFAAVYDYSSSTIRLWINGNSIGSIISSADTTADISTGNLLIGQQFRGYMSSLAIFQRALTQADITSLQSNVFDRWDQDLVLFLPLATDFKDYSIRGTDATSGSSDIISVTDYPLCFPSSNCFPNPCFQGTCSETSGGTCRCFPGYYGARCNMTYNILQECIPGFVADTHAIFGSGLTNLEVDGSATTLASGFTISMFVRTENSGKGTTATLISNPNLNITLQWITSSIPTLQFTFGSRTVSTPLWCRILGKWTHIAASYNTNGDLTIYIDEKPRATSSGSSPLIVSPIPKNSFLIGANFVGRIDEVRFYERALLLTDLDAIRQNNAPSSFLDFYLPMSNNVSTFKDHAGTERYTPKLIDVNRPARLRVNGTSIASTGELPLCLPPAPPCFPNPCIYGTCKATPATMQPTPATYDPDTASWVNPQYNLSWYQASAAYQCVCFAGYTGPDCAIKTDARTCGEYDNQHGIFNGNNDVTVPSADTNFGSPGFTVSLWAYLPSTAPHQEFMKHGDAAGIHFGFNAGILSFGLVSSANAAVPLGSAVENEWHHYAATLRSVGASVEYVIFVDGVRVAVQTQPTWYKPAATDASLFSGFVGRLDNFRILNVSITDSDALSQYLTGSYDSSYTSLWLPFGSHEFSNLADNSARQVTLGSWISLPTFGNTRSPMCLDVRVVPGSVVPLVNAAFGATNNASWCSFAPCNAIYAYHHSKLGFSMILKQIDSNGLPLPPINAHITAVGFKTETYGRLFSCLTSSVAPIYQSLQPVYFTCETPVAGGNELQFVIQYCLHPGPCYNSTLIPLSSTLLRGITNTTFRYPQPTINPVSLLRTSVAGEPKVPLNRWTAKKQGVPETFTFTGSYFLTDPELMTITYGPSYNHSLFQTTPIFNDPAYPFNENRVHFSTDVTGIGFDLVFTVNVAGVEATGTDTYAYPEVPEVYSVSGCNFTSGNETLNCPTYGRVLVTIVGKGFVDQRGNGSNLQLFADVSGVTCQNLTLLNSSTITCILPAGAGLGQPVRVFSLGFFSNPKPLVSYGLPQIVQLRGGSGNVTDGKSCANTDSLNLHHCPREAGTWLTITGENFGVSGSVIILGVRQCTNVTHTDPVYHSEVKCLMPKGNQQYQPVLLIVERGEISKSRATVGFSPCPPGFFENSTNQLCDQCKTGEYSDTEGSMGSCPPCSPGSISTTRGASTCTLCGKGQFQSAPGQTACKACEPGKFAGVPGRDVCQACVPGKANTGFEDGSKCADCVQGRVQALSGQSTCDACPAGKTSNSQLLACAQCVPGSAAPLEAATQCVLCPANSYSSPGTINCECEAGMYGFFRGNYTLEANPEKVVCVKCPPGAACNKQGIWRWSIPALPGYWHETQDALNFEPCLFDTHCPGQFGFNDTGCGSNRFGLLCANCLPGYKSTGGAAACDECPAAVAESWGWSVLFVVGIFFGLAVVYAVVLRADAQQDRAFSGKIGEVKLSSLPPILNMGDASVLTTNLVLTEENQRTSRFTSTLKIVVGFFQICTSLSVFNDVKLPSYYATFIGIFNVINLDFVPWTSLSCVANFNFFTKTLLTGFIPIVLIGSCTVGFFGWYKIAQARDFSDDPGPRKKRKSYRLKFWKLLLFTLFLLYPSVSSSLLRYFVCREINFRYWLLADLNMPCSDGIWLDNLPYAALFVLVYPIGIPTMFFILMFRRRTKLRRVNTIQTYSFLYQAYIEKVWFFEEIEMIHKLIMTSILQFFPGAMRFQAGMVVTYLYICAILLISPYVQKKNEILAIICEIEIMLLLLAGNAMTAEGQLPVGSFLDVLLSVLLIGATIFAILLFVATAIHHARQNYWTKKRLHAEKAGKRNRPRMPHEFEMSETSVVSSKNSEGVSEIDDSDFGESDNIKTARDAQEAMQDALQSTLSEQIVPFHMVVIESVMTIWDDLRRKPCCEVIMKRVHRYGDPCANWFKHGWDSFVRCGQAMLSRLGCIKCAAYFRRLTCGTCCEKRKAGKPKLYTSAMMELMLPEARHVRSASEHLLRAGNDKTDITSSGIEEDDDSKLELEISNPITQVKTLKSALKKPKESEEALLRSPPESKPSKPRKLTLDEKQTVARKVSSVTRTESNGVSPKEISKEAPSPKETASEEKKKDNFSEEKRLERALSTKQADAAAGLAAKMAARLASKKAQVDGTSSPTSSPASSPMSRSDAKPAKVTPASSETKEEVLIVAPENRPMTKSVAEGRPRGETSKPDKPAKPGRVRGTTNITPSTQTSP